MLPKSKVNNAGAVYGGPKLMEVTPEDIDATFATSVRGPILLMQATVLHMPRFGRIINISSVASKPITCEGVALYGGGKAAMDQITFAAAAEVRSAPLCTCLGLLLTPIFRSASTGKILQ